MTSVADLTDLSPTARTTPTRGRERAVAARAELLALLDDALLAHVGLPVSRLTRTAVGPIQLQRMRSGSIRRLSIRQRPSRPYSSIAFCSARLAAVTARILSSS